MDDVKKYILAYNDFFNDTFPSYPLRGRGDEECVRIIKDCLERQKDVYELGYIDRPKHDIYY